VPKFAQSALDKGVVHETDLDAALQHLMLMKIRLGYFDPRPSPLASIGVDQVCSPAARQLARDAARQGAVLLKNSAATLPLSQGMSVAAIGPNIALSQTLALYYAGEPCDHKFWTLEDALEQHASQVAAVSGLSSVTSSDPKDFPAAAAAAAAADAVVFALGNDLTVESEGHDRDEIALYAGQVALVQYVCNALAAADGNKRVVAVTFGGGMIDLSPLLNSSCVGAVVHAGYPSVQVLGVGDILFGLASPAARLTATMLPADFVNEVQRCGPAFCHVPALFAFFMRTDDAHHLASPFNRYRCSTSTCAPAGGTDNHSADGGEDDCVLFAGLYVIVASLVAFHLF
jgi:beta-D-xylosidase 4